MFWHVFFPIMISSSKPLFGKRKTVLFHPSFNPKAGGCLTLQRQTFGWNNWNLTEGYVSFVPEWCNNVIALFPFHVGWKWGSKHSGQSVQTTKGAESLLIPLKQMCLHCQASPAGCNDGPLGYLSSESSAWDWRPKEEHNKDYSDLCRWKVKR